MKKQSSFFLTVCALAVPVALQSMLQSSFGVVDQIMIGQLGSVSVAGVGLAGKFASIVSVAVAGIGSVAGIMMAQYLGQENPAAVRRSMRINLLLGCALAGVFTLACVLWPESIMGLYTQDDATRQAAAEYLAIVAGSFLPMTGATLMSTYYRCIEKARIPLYASLLSALVNTGLNYVLIFGRLGLPAMGAAGAGAATVISQMVNLALMLLMLPGHRAALSVSAGSTRAARFSWRQYGGMLLPILICEVVWSLGENVYAAIYGHMGTQASAAMTLTGPVQGLLIGALCGLSQAAGVLIGKKLGSGDFDRAYRDAKRLSVYGAVGAAALSAVIMLTAGVYVEIYQVEDAVKQLTVQILFAYALVAPFKVLNMILGGGVIRSGGKTKYIMAIDMIGTWGFGVPLGLVSAFVLHLAIPYVYFILSLEECVRFGLTVAVFRRRKWMNSLDTVGAEG